MINYIYVSFNAVYNKNKPFNKKSTVIKEKQINFNLDQ